MQPVDHVYDILLDARAFVETSFCKNLAQTKNQINNPQGEWLAVNPKADKPDWKYVPADSWSITGAILAAEFWHLSGNTIPQKNELRKEKPSWQQPLLMTNAHEYVFAVVKELGYNYIADYETERKTTQSDAIEVMNQAIDLYLNRN